MDLTATVLQAAGIGGGAAAPLDGVSLRPLLEGGELERGALCFHYPRYAWHHSNRPGGAVRSGCWKCIRRYDDRSLELFDLSRDPGEENNLAEQEPERAAELDGRLARWLGETGAQMPVVVR